MTQSDQAIKAASAVYPRIDPTTVVGWGVDADTDNDPTWPMRDRSKDDGPGMNWTPPVQQQTDIEILQSVEYGRRPAVVGVSTPPSGLSGVIRRQAFRFSEGQWGHWLLLMLADRVNAVEGLGQDLRRGRAPNLLVETGIVSHSRSREAAAASIGALIVLGVAAAVIVNRRRD